MNIPMSRHASLKLAEAGFSPAAVAEAYSNPTVTYPSGRYKGQEKRIGGGLCLCVDTATGVIVTVFIHKAETALRADQTDRDAVAWSKRTSRY